MKPIGFWKLFVLPFYSPDVYVDSARNRKGFMIVPFLLFFLVCSIPYVINLVSTMGVWDKAMTEQMSKMPEFTISNGKLSLPTGTKPFISFNNENKIAVVIDPTAEEDILKPYERGILFSEKKLYAKNGINTPFVEYPQKGTSLVNYSVIRNTMVLVYVLFVIVGLPLLLGSLFFIHFFIVVTIHFVSAFFPEAREMDRQEVFRIAITATMPMTLVLCLLRAAGMETLLLYFGAVVISAFFMNFGLKQAVPPANQ